MSRPESPKNRQHQELWLRAQHAPLELPCKTKANATLVRFQLYNAVKAVRKNPTLDLVLATAISSVSITLVDQPDGTCKVRMAKSEAMAVLDAACEALGIADPTPQMPTADELSASLGRLGQIEPEEPQRIDYAEMMRQRQGSAS